MNNSITTTQKPSNYWYIHLYKFADNPWCIMAIIPGMIEDEYKISSTIEQTYDHASGQHRTILLTHVPNHILYEAAQYCLDTENYKEIQKP